MGVIYKATNLIDGKAYIGQTKNFETRKRQHLRAKDDYPFHLALRKYGEENFEWAILEECDNSELNKRESYWIFYYNTYRNGYNVTKGGDNADALISWIKNNPEESRKNALNGLRYAQLYNKNHREEHLKQLALAREKGIAIVSKKVRCIELNLIFNSIAEAERWSITKENPSGKIAHHQHISKVCKGQRHTAGGFHWEYI